jgi:YgiT-type zinc finger domain-containing protein
MGLCSICGGPTVKKKVTFSQEVNGVLEVVENVPAEVFTQCGDQLFDPKTVRALEKILRSKRKPTKTINVPVFDFEKQPV